MADLEKLHNIAGRVICLSHTFRLKAQPLFIMKFLYEDSFHFIFVRRQSQLSWHSEIHPGFYYSVSNLREGVIYEETHNVTILSTTRHSKVTLIKEGSLQIWTCIPRELPSLICYKGTITNIVNDEVGIYCLGGILLIVTYLKDVVAELDNHQCLLENVESTSFPERTPESRALFYVGNEITVYNAHVFKGRDGVTTLVCCGRSLIRSNRMSKPLYESVLCVSGVVHCIHRFNMGLDFLYWLLDLQKVLLDSFSTSEELHNMITRRKWQDRPGILCRFVEKHLRTSKTESRSLLQEFIFDEHSCVLFQEFGIVSSLEVSSLSNYFSQPRGESTICFQDQNLKSFWNYSVIGKNEHSVVLFGILNISNEGRYVLHSQNQHINIVVLGISSELFDKIGTKVSVSNFHFVEEKFNAYGCEPIYQTYIILQCTHIVCLEDIKKEYAVCGSQEELINFELKLLTVSGLWFPVNNLEKSLLSGFFVANANINKNSKNLTEPKSWESLIKIKGSHVTLYPLLWEPCIIKGNLRLKTIPDLYFRKTFQFMWLNSVDKYLGTSMCVEMPAEFEVMSIQGIPVTASCKLSDILVGKGYEDRRWFDIEGTVVQKKFMTPKFLSQKVHLPINALRNGVGVPGSKVVRLLVQDKDDPGISVWIYLSSSSCTFAPQYHLGLIPGAEVHITFLERFVSRNNFIYLAGTLLTKVRILNFTASKEPKYPSKFKFLSEVKKLPSGSVCLFFGTVTRILNVVFRCVCPACDSDIENGKCTYIGCQANQPGTIAGTAKIIVEDGSDEASVFTNDVEHIKALFSITRSQWSILSEASKEQRLIFINRKGCMSQFESYTQKCFAFFLTNQQNFRPLKIVGRIFPKRESTTFHQTDLFALKLTPISPLSDNHHLS